MDFPLPSFFLSYCVMHVRVRRWRACPRQNHTVGTGRGWQTTDALGSSFDGGGSGSSSGTTIDDYEGIKAIGKGKFAMVYR